MIAHRSVDVGGGWYCVEFNQLQRRCGCGRAFPRKFYDWTANVRPFVLYTRLSTLHLALCWQMFRRGFQSSLRFSSSVIHLLMASFPCVSVYTFVCVLLCSKIADSLVKALIKVNCPYPLQSHQIQVSTLSCPPTCPQLRLVCLISHFHCFDPSRISE